jgi:hypothetical protein
MAFTVDGSNSIKAVRRLGLHSTPSLTFLEAASQTYVKGSPLIASSGLAAITGAVANPVDIIGISESAATGTTNDPVRVNPISADIVYEGILGKADLSDRVTAQTDIGTAYGINRDATNLGFFVDVDNTTPAEVKVRVIGFKDAVGTTNGRVYFTFLQVADHANTPISINALSGT